MTAASPVCLTCSGEGQIADEAGPRACPDCEGEGRLPPLSTLIDRRLFAIERTLRHRDPEARTDIGWLVHELRRGRTALTRILTRCMDDAATDPVARDIKLMAIEALGLYDPEPR